MAITRSTGLVDFVASHGSVRTAMNNCRVMIFSGTMPTGPDAADVGYGSSTLLVTLTANGGAYTPEVRPAWHFTMSGAGGQIDSIKIGGIEQLPAPIAYSTSISTLAADVVAAINNNGAAIDFTAAVTGAGSDEVTIYGPVGVGDSLNGLTLSVTASGGLTATESNSGAVQTAGSPAVNGCQFDYEPATGQIRSVSGVPWSGVAVASGTATWFMMVTDGDSGASSSTTARRIIGSVGTSGADLDLSSTSVTAGITITANDWYLTVAR